jgi:hypothetical protein
MSLDPAPVHASVRVPLTGCDAFFLALEDLMRLGGQGHHIGLTVLALDGPIALPALCDAVRRFSLSHPLLHAKIRRFWLVGFPYWAAEPPFCSDAVSVTEHPAETDRDSLCARLLEGDAERFLEIHVIPAVGRSTVIARWRHLLFDGRGAELALQEISRLAGSPEEPVQPVASWGMPFTPWASLFERWRGTRAFVRRHYELKPADFQSPGGPIPRPAAPQFRVVFFSREETAAILARAAHVTGGIFQMPYFLAAVARAHAAVMASRGECPASFVTPVPVQARKARARHPIFQNQITVLHFKLLEAELRDFQTAVASVQNQFESSVRGHIEASAASTLWWMRLLPAAFYRWFLQHDTGGEVVSFFQSHTGEFLPGVRAFCGVPIANAWHVPAVSQPPGSGLFFSQRDGRLTATISWRKGSLTSAEVALMEHSLRKDLLPEGAG